MSVSLHGPALPRRSTGWPALSLRADHADLAALRESAQRQAARARRRACLRPEHPCAGRFVDRAEVPRDAAELHLASFCLVGAELRLAGADDPAPAAPNAGLAKAALFNQYIAGGFGGHDAKGCSASAPATQRHHADAFLASPHSA